MRATVDNLRIVSSNLLRNRRRSAIALLTIATGVIVMMLADGFMQWIFWAMREGTIQSQLGHIAVVRPGYLKAGSANPFDYILPDEAPQRKKIEHSDGVVTVAPRLKVSGLASHGDITISFIGEGVDPAREEALSKAFRIVKGQNLSGIDSKEVILGEGLARDLGVGPGDTLSLLSTPAGGGVNGVEATVAGLFRTGNKAYNETALRLPLRLAQSLLRVKGSHQWLILLERTEDTDRTLKHLRQMLGDHSRLELVPWYQRADFYNKTVRLFSRQMWILKLIIGSIIVLSISNILVMNVLERTSEIGTLLAIGFRRRKILVNFVEEGLVLALVGCLAGLLAGGLLAQIISGIGIPMPPPPGMEKGYSGEIRITATVVATAAGIAFATTLVAGLYPAWKASRLQIVDALRHGI